MQSRQNECSVYDRVVLSAFSFLIFLSFSLFLFCLGSFLPSKLISFVFRRAVAFQCFWVLCMLLRLSGECDNRDNASSPLELICDFFVTKKPQRRNDCSHCYRKQSLAYWKSRGNFAQETYCFCSISFLPPVYVNWIRCCFFSSLAFQNQLASVQMQTQRPKIFMF